VAFDYADGYSLGSGLRTIQEGKTTKYKMDYNATPAMTFVLETGSGKRVTVQIDTEQMAPKKVTATYTSGGKSTTFTLTQSK
jgi:hypothetical protein